MVTAHEEVRIQNHSRLHVLPAWSKERGTLGFGGGRGHGDQSPNRQLAWTTSHTWSPLALQTLDKAACPHTQAWGKNIFLAVMQLEDSVFLVTGGTPTLESSVLGLSVQGGSRSAAHAGLELDSPSAALVAALSFISGDNHSGTGQTECPLPVAAVKFS